MRYEDYLKKIEDCLDNILINIEKLGKILIAAHKDLTVEVYGKLVKAIKDSGFTQSDIDAAIKVGAGELDKRLFLPGAKSSKILTLDNSEQQRLLSGEKFGILRADGTVEKLSFAEMNESERNQLLGSKGGKIHAPHEQKAGKQNREKSISLCEVSYRNGQITLTFDGGTKFCKVQTGTLIAKCAADDLDQLLENINEVRADLIAV